MATLFILRSSCESFFSRIGGRIAMQSFLDAGEQ